MGAIVSRLMPVALLAIIILVGWIIRSAISDSTATSLDRTQIIFGVIVVLAGIAALIGYIISITS